MHESNCSDKKVFTVDMRIQTNTDKQKMSGRHAEIQRERNCDTYRQGERNRDRDKERMGHRREKERKIQRTRNRKQVRTSEFRKSVVLSVATVAGSLYRLKYAIKKEERKRSLAIRVLKKYKNKKHD